MIHYKFFVPLTFLAVTFCLARAFSCETDSISIVHESSFFSLFNSNKDEESANTSTKINIPVSTESGNGCFSIRSHLNISVQISKKSSDYEIDISPMKVTSENIPDFHEKNLIHFIDDENPGQAKVSVISYACTGEKVLAVEYYEGKIENFLSAKKQDNSGFSTSMFFATGAAAKNLAQMREFKTEEDVLNQNFALNQLIPNSDLSGYFVKPIIPDFLISEYARGRYTSLRHSLFSNNGKVINICNPTIATLLQTYSLENFNEDLFPNRSIKIKKKKSGITIKKEF